MIVSGDRHDGARAVTHQHKVSYPDWQRLVSQWMLRPQAGVHTQFFHRGHIGLGHGAGADLLAEGMELSIFGRCRLHKGMLWR